MLQTPVVKLKCTVITLSRASCKRGSASSYFPNAIKAAAWPFKSMGVEKYLSLNSWRM